MGTPAPSFNKYESIGGPADSGLPATSGSGGGTDPGEVVTPTPINQNLVFDSSKRMPLFGYQTQGSALNFNCSNLGAVEQASIDIYLLANGNPITISGADVFGAGPKTIDGLRQVLSFVYSAGVITCFVSYFGIVDDGGSTTPGDTTAPTMNARSVSNGSPTFIDVVFTEAMDVTSVPIAANFTVGGHTVNSFAFVDSTHAHIGVTSAFVNGEAARTLAYNGTALRDSAGNLLAAFSNAAIVNNVQATPQPGDTTPPVITTRAVENGTPTVMNLTFNEPMNTNVLPVASAWTVGGHAVNTFAWVDSTHANLTLGSAFVNGEAARTLAYVVPGSGQTQDVAGNWLAAFSGAAIVNNVQANTVSDNFNRADSTSSAGTGWNNINDSVAGISGNKMYFSTASVDPRPWGGNWRECGSANGTIEADITLDPYFLKQGISFRRIDDNNGLFAWIQEDQLQIYSVQGGVRRIVKSFNTGTSSFPKSSTQHAKITMSTSAISFQVGAITVTASAAEFASTAYDGSNVSMNSTATKHGFFDGGNALGLYDNFLFTPA